MRLKRVLQVGVMSYYDYETVLDYIKHVSEGYHGVPGMDRAKYGICSLLGFWSNLAWRMCSEFYSTFDKKHWEWISPFCRRFFERQTMTCSRAQLPHYYKFTRSFV